ncbi:glycosyltransferase [Flavobacterium sp. KS-LB2]|uniref:glycosyltransferase n=1 Tax=Flavobacterium sp. KS-LB2 TaxID=3120525 RepID=UPI0030CDDEB4
MKKKVFIVGPCLSMGGMERASVNTANALKEEGFEVVFVSIFKKAHFFKLNNGIVFEDPEGFNTKSLSLLKTVLWIKILIKAHKPQKVLAFNKFYGAITALAMMGNKTPFYISERSSPLFIWEQPIKTINRIAYWLKPPTGVIAQTSIAASYQKKYFPKSKIEVIPNILRSVTTYPEIKRRQVILAVGRLGDHLKGFDLLLKSFAMLKNTDWELHIAGGNENGQALKDLALKLGINNRLSFLGKVKDIDTIYAYAGIYVIPSRSEGFPNALAEAMAAVCCCVAFDFVAGPQDMIAHTTNGILVENGNINKMAEALDALILNPTLRQQLGEEAKKLADELDAKVISHKIMNFLELEQ